MNSYFLFLPKTPKVVIKHPRNPPPPKVDLSLGRKDKEISSVRSVVDGRFSVKITITKIGDKNQIQNSVQLFGAQVS